MTVFNYTGSVQTYTVPSGVTSVIIKCWGAQGGDYLWTGGGSSGTGGKGGYSEGVLTVTPGSTLNVYVGGQGNGINTDGSVILNGNGYNGGGQPNPGSGGGGGASDVRVGGTALSDQKIVAGGGGAGGWTEVSSTTGLNGGDGGWTSGLDGGNGGVSNIQGRGGTSSHGGAAGTGGLDTGNAGSRGSGGDSPTSLSAPSGAGGGGYYGGGSGVTKQSSGSYYSGAGGGGSGYTGGMTSGASSSSGVQSGNGKVEIIPANQPGDVTAVSAGLVLGVTAPTTGVGTSVYTPSAGLSFGSFGATPPVITASQVLNIPSSELDLCITSPGIGSSVGAVSSGLELVSGGPITIYWNGLTAVSAGLDMGMPAPTAHVYIRPPVLTYTDDEYRAKFLDPQTNITRRVEILEADGNTLWEGISTEQKRLITGSVSVDYTRDERRTLDVELDNFDKALIHQPDKFWYDKVIRVWRGIEFYDTTAKQSYEVSVGKFIMDQITYTRTPATVKVTARDFTKRCLLSKFTQSLSFAAGTLITDIISALAANSGCTDQIIPVSTDALGTDTSFDRGTSRWECMKQISDAYGYEVFFDANGFLVLRKYLDPTTSPISYTFQTGTNEGNLVDWSEVADDTQLFNHVSVAGADADSVPIVADAYNDNPASPTNIDEIGDRVYTFDSDFITDQDQAQSLADSLLAVNGLEEFTINMSSIVAPWLEVGEIVRFLKPTVETIEPDRFLLTTLTVPLDLSPMSATGRRVLIVS